MRFHVFRFVGILALGIAALQLAMITKYYSDVEFDFIRNFILFLVIAAFFLSTEKNKSHVLHQKG